MIRLRPAPVAAAALLFVAACANVAFPPGGPEDRDSPTISSSLPPAGAARVARDSALSLTFSERPDKRSVLKSLRVIPPVDFRESAWTDSVLRLVPEGGWAEGRNTFVRIGAGAKDRRGNFLEKPFVTWFSTKAFPDSGTIRGKIWPGREIGKDAKVFVAAFPGADEVADAAPHSIADLPENGTYRLVGLDTSVPWRIVAWLDTNGDLLATEEGEIQAVAPAPVTFADSAVAVAADFLLGTLDSVGTLSGEVLVDSGAVAGIRAVSADDERNTILDGGGAFSLEVPTGAVWRVHAWLDQDGNEAFGESEPHVDLEDALSLELTAARSGIRLDLRGVGGADGTAVVDSTTVPAGPEAAQENEP